MPNIERLPESRALNPTASAFDERTSQLKAERQQEQDRRDKDFHTVVKYAGDGYVDEAKFYAKSKGLNVPDQIYQNADLAKGMALSRDIYGDDKESASKFTKTWSQMPADMSYSDRYNKALSLVPPSDPYDRKLKLLEKQLILKQQYPAASGGGGRPSAPIQIANKLRELEDIMRSPTSSAYDKFVANRDWNNLNQAGKSFAMERGTEYPVEYFSGATPQQQAQPVAPSTQQPVVDAQIPAPQPQIPVQTSGPREIQGFTDIVAKRQAEIEKQKAIAKEEGKEIGVSTADLEERVSSMPQLINMTQRLSALGKLATYTMAGQMRDKLSREAGLEVGDPAIARATYISAIDNEILPLLRQTFGAQFTEREGDSLKRTLGDPDLSPPEKDAALKSFIRTKMETINTRARRVGKQDIYSNDDINSIVRGVSSGSNEQDLGVSPEQPSSAGIYTEGQTATNPNTGERIIYTNGKWEQL